jgi:amidohydrolase
MKQLIQQLANEVFDEAVLIRRHLHQHPELSFEEYETSKFIQSKLTEWGIPFETGFVKTGIVAFIQSPNSSQCIGLRADMDALPIQEENDVSYKSIHHGIMHACGHDVHTAMLLGAAKALNKVKDQLPKGVKLIFQPGEEKLPGGAKLMIEEGVLTNPDVEEMYALHVFPELEAGKVGLKSGMYMASCDEIHMTVKGKGGHAAMPHLNIDPIVISANIITQLQQVVSRHCPPQIPCVLSFGRIEGLGATNVIPDTVAIQGTFRTMNEAWRSKAHELIKTQCESIAKQAGGSVEIDIQVGYPYLENNPEITEKAKQKAIEQLGNDAVIDLPIRLTGEDFAFFAQAVPSTFIRIGVRNEKEGITKGVHNAQFNIDESAIKTGIEVLLAQTILP